MLKGGVIMDVVDAAQARIAEEAGACAVMVRLPFESPIAVTHSGYDRRSNGYPLTFARRAASHGCRTRR